MQQQSVCHSVRPSSWRSVRQLVCMVFSSYDAEFGKIYSWGKTNPLQQGRAGRVIKSLEGKRVISIACGTASTAAIAVNAYPSWSEIKPILLGWLKDENCCFHHSRGVPLVILQLILEFAWSVVLPQLSLNFVNN